MRLTIALCLCVVVATGCATPADDTQTPAWLAAQIADYEKRPLHEVPSEIWRLTHKGKPAWYVVSACCDFYNPLLDSEGNQICAPNGGFTGHGDGNCAGPNDPGTRPTLVWSHPTMKKEDIVTPEFDGDTK